MKYILAPIIAAVGLFFVILGFLFLGTIFNVMSIFWNFEITNYTWKEHTEPSGSINKGDKNPIKTYKKWLKQMLKFKV
jgi:hypothetical protein